MPVGVPTAVFRKWGEAKDSLRRDTTLYLDLEEFVAVVRLQGSVYGGRYYLQGRRLAEGANGSEASKAHQCHVQTRLAGMRPAPDDDGLEQAFLMRDNDLSDDERRSQFRDVLDSVVAPTLRRTRTLADVKDPAVIGRFAVGADAHHRLGLRGGLGETTGRRPYRFRRGVATGTTFRRRRRLLLDQEPPEA